MPPIIETDGDEDRDQDDGQQRTSNAESVEVEREAEVEAPEVEVVEDSGESDEGDERISQTEDDGGQQQRRRETSAERRQRAKDAKLRSQREIDFQKRELQRLEKTVWELTQGQIATRVTEIDNRIATAAAEVNQWDSIKAKAITAKNGDDAVAADNLRQAAQQKLDQAHWEKQRIAQAQQQPARPDTTVESYKKEFFDANPWYKQDGLDEDSLIVKAIDHAVAQKYRATDPTYWSELQKRIDARLGKNVRKNKQDDSDDSYEDDADVEQEARPVTRRGPPVGGSNRSNSSSANTQQIKLSPDRVQALKDAGLWDDPKTRQRMAKKYAEYDRQTRG
jgi:hypothetical protein